MEFITDNFAEYFTQYVSSPSLDPHFILGDALLVLSKLPDECIDFSMTSPPYWGQRQYLAGGIGLEDTPEEYISNLLAIFREIHRVLKPTGSFWLNIGDTYRNKSLLGIPWRVALCMMDEQGWVLRNSVIWHKVKGAPDNSKDKLRNVHEPVFHFTKKPRGYYYDVDAIRAKPRASKVVNGAVVSATGVTGVRYRRQIELSTALTDEEKECALIALDEMLDRVRRGEISDFRMIIRDQQRTTHSNSTKVSGRARELEEKGYYFLMYDPKGSKPGDVWEVIPEDTQKREFHFAPYPEDLCKIPLLATCPEDGIALDPFCGTGTTNYVARILGRKSVGIDLSEEYLRYAIARSSILL
jgi:DNA modification methylase